jgi:putative ABC transport system permease protein
METLLHDFRYGLRALAKALGFTAVAVVTLALGIGANTASFSVVNTVLLRSLPYPDSDRIVNIPRPTVGDSVPMFTSWKDNNPGFEDLSAHDGPTDANLETGARPELISAVKVSQNYFRLFGATPILGRLAAEFCTIDARIRAAISWCDASFSQAASGPLRPAWLTLKIEVAPHV